VRDFLRGDNFVKGLWLSLICLLLVIPYILWAYYVSSAGYVEKNLPPEKIVPFLILDIFKIWVAMQISATAGYAWAKKPWLAGAGSLNDFMRSIPLIIFLGIGIAAVEILIFDFRLLKPLMQLEPLNPFLSGRYVTQELILRFGIMSIAFRLIKSIPIAIIISAVFDALLMLEGVLSTGIIVPKGLLAIGLAKGTILAVFYGYLCAKRGLIADMSVRFVVGMKVFIYMLLR
jgi:hypothetical protein